MLSAQDPPPFEEVLPDSLIEEDKKTMETMMIWKLTEELELQVEQADKFFPRFREHRKAIDEIKNKERALGKSLNQNMKNNDKIRAEEVNKIIK